MAYDFHSVKILIVEDNQPMLDLAKSILQTFGVGTVLTARNGEEGFRVYCAENPEIVLVDWMMKPMDGISMTRLIRNDPKSPNQFVPIILMTGFSEKRRVFQARDAGVTEFLVKPFTARDLYRRIAQIIEKPRKFVRSDDFFGPDRRRTKKQEYYGPYRRETDIVREKDRPGYDRGFSPRAISREEMLRQNQRLESRDEDDLDDEIDFV